MIYSSMSDEDVALEASRGDENACEYILTKYKYLVRSVARRYFLSGGDINDIVQEGMIGLYKAICSFDASKGANIATYSVKCIRDQIINAITTANSLKHAPLNDYVSLSINDSDDDASFSVYDESMYVDPEETVLSQESYEILNRKIDEVLTKKELSVLKLYLQGLSYDDMSKELGINNKSIDNALRRVKNKLKTHILKQ